MKLKVERARVLLDAFDFQRLFIDEMGWDNHAASLTVDVEGDSFALNACAQKRGVVVWRMDSAPGALLPDREVRKKIERQVAKTTLEHLIIFTDSAKREQIWCWARREPGKPVAVLEHFWRVGSANRAFLQKLEAITFTFTEEGGLGLIDVTNRLRSALDVERVTKRFFDQFTKEHKAFLGFISGIEDVADKEWYASLMLNRLMFIYFMQKKGFLNGESDYLRTRLAKCQAEKGKDAFYSFYRYFLIRLFHEGLGSRPHDPELVRLLGKIPYLNGGLFEKHPIEDRCPDIQIPDAAFERIFAYFDRYTWHLDERPLRNENEINPDVLGYIFEKYINQKQMGAYYTKGDITEYISKNTVIPFLFNAAKAKCNVAFENPGGPTVWDHLRDDPDRYIYPAVKHGISWDIHADEGRGAPLDSPHDLPANIAAGIADVAQRGDWNRSAPADFSLPTEIWREVVARRTRYAEVRAKLANGEVREINDLITLNLDIRQFVQDVIERCEGPDLLRAFWKAIENLTVLDPTCGSGAFLFAALNILEPLYAACFDRMEAFVADRQRASGKEEDNPKGFREVLARIDAHPNARYFILKSIILNNLFGVDIMEEAVEICKLRLFLKLAAQVEPDMRAANLGIEPLPDIDFNIKAGNTLVGYATWAEVEKSAEGDWIRQQELEQIRPKAADLQQAFNEFRRRQIMGDGSVPGADKEELKKRLGVLEQRLNNQLAKSCGVKLNDLSAMDAWAKSHRPFHWFIEFFGIMDAGGFDVIVGNPPYAEIPKHTNRHLLRSVFKTALEKWSRDEDLYTLVVERSLRLLRAESGQFGMILPLSLAFSTKRPYTKLREVLETEGTLSAYSHFDRIPSALFGNEVRTRCTIVVISRDSSQKKNTLSTALFRWSADARDTLFARLTYSGVPSEIGPRILKLSSNIQSRTVDALLKRNLPLGLDLRDTIPFAALARMAPRFPRNAVYVGGTAYNWFPAWREIPETTDVDGRPSLPARTAGYRFATEDEANLVFALLCSSMGYWWWSVASDGFNLKKWLLDAFPVSTRMFSARDRALISSLGAELLIALRAQYVFKDNKGRIGNFFLPGCQDVVLKIDTAIEQADVGIEYGFFADIREHNAIFAKSGLSGVGVYEEQEY
ncbi:Eco57I restriction-modification methylase domain-containing protein [Paenirhodobacter populi]|uniref:site-specific DNA-methyltransferase (adenine-specific) n=1 Tax=Paenirhodobacter populi TaxID=2306993 RepID=A0A443JN14_9RHOB|nr:DNA methyltransferase [Sinirhodobacter populi]RWR21898.1 SAM-dependent methyltransferase [Sinirhodobacter populi]